MRQWADIPKEERTAEDGYREAVRRIKKARETGAEELDLSQLKLEKIPMGLTNVEGLTRLFLADNQLTNLVPLTRLKRLTRLGLSDNQLMDLSPLADLKRLTRLYLNNNQLIDLAPLADLKGLTRLYLNNNQLIDLAPLADLKGLTRLGLGNNQITDIGPLAGLAHLTVLWLQKNQLSDISPLAGLVQLNQLVLRENQIENIRSLSRLTQLSGLALDRNRLSDISPLSGLTNLTELSITYNQIIDIRPLSGLTLLNDLWISENPIASIRPLKGLLNRLHKLYITPTPQKGIHLNDYLLTDPPVEVAKKGTEAVLDYWLAQETGGENNYSARILLVGQGRAGKTTLRRKMENPTSLVPSEIATENASTVGIRTVQNYQVPTPSHVDENFYKAHIWDFGGQREQHVPHQYFFGRSSLYVVLVDIGSGIGELGYWLRLIDLHGRRTDGKKTDVVVVFNEKIPQPADYSLDGFTIAFPDLELHKVKVNLSFPYQGEDRNDPRFNEELLRVIHREFAKLPKIGESVPAPTIPILKEINRRRQIGDHFLNYKDFATICSYAGVDDEDIVRALIDYFRRTGEVLHFAPVDEEQSSFFNLKDYVFIDVDWAAIHVYDLLGIKVVEKNHGRFDERLLQKIWKQYYPGETYDVLKKLLMEDALEICFSVPGQVGQYVAAPLLPVSSTGLAFSAEKIGAFTVRLHFTKHIPVGLVTRLIVRMNEFLVGDNFYRTGAIFYDRDGKRAKAKVEVDINNEHFIYISLDQGGIAGRSLLDTIRREINAIIRATFPAIEFTFGVPCTCPKCAASPLADKYYFPLNFLEKKEARGPNQVVDCQQSAEEVNVSQLLGQVNEEATLEWGRYTREITNHTTNIYNAPTNTGSGTQLIDQRPPAPPTPPFYQYLLANPHLRATLGYLAGAGAVGIAAYYLLPKDYRGYAGVIFVVAALFGVFVAMNKKGKYYTLARWALGIGFGVLGILNGLPLVDGLLIGDVPGSNGELSGFLRFALDPSPWISIFTLVGTLLFAAYCLWLNHKQESSTHATAD